MVHEKVFAYLQYVGWAEALCMITAATKVSGTGGGTAFDLGELIFQILQRLACNSPQVLRFSFPRKKILGLVYKCYRNELLMS